MRLIPGNTKVQIEIFKGITLWDVLVGAIDVIVLGLVVSSSLPFKWIIACVFSVIAIVLLARFDNEPNYLYLIHIIRHFGFSRKFSRGDDEYLKSVAKDGSMEVFFNEDENPDLSVIVPKVESKEEKKARIKAEKAEWKADSKRLKDKDISKEEEDAIWLKRAKQSEQKKKDRLEAKKQTHSKLAKESFEDMKRLSAFTEIKDGFISYHGKYFGAAVEVSSVEFRFFSEFRRNNAIENSFGSILRALKPDYSFNIVKIERPIDFYSYEQVEKDKLEELRRSFEQGFIKEDELKTRVAVVYDRLNEIQNLEKNNKVVVPFYYLVFFDVDKKQLKMQVDSAIESLRAGEITGKRLNDKELALFLKYSNSLDFNEKDIEEIRPEDYAMWAMPESVEFMPRFALIDNIATHNFKISNYPTKVDDAWLASLMTYPSTKVVIKVKPMDSSKAIRSIDKSLSELRTTVNSAKTDSEAMAAQVHLETLQYLLTMLQNDNEVLLDTNIYVSAYDAQFTENNPKLPDLEEGTFRCRINQMKKMVRRAYSEVGFKLNNMEFNQAVAYIGSQVSGYDPLEKKGRGIPSNTVSACFPWVFPRIMDKEGVHLGSSDGVPVFIDFFKRDSERVNSNMVIVGKSGSGKSYATKTILSNLAADDAKIFVLDPEDEYTQLAENLHGKFINVATNQYGRLNPFHIITNLEDDQEGTAASSYSIHLQFLEEFFRQILPDCDKDSLEYLNTLVDRIYKRKGINSETDLSKLKPTDYPIFDDLYDEILREFQKTQNEYIRTMLRTLMNYISKFSDGGRNAAIWNGPSSITTEENFTVFNFQSLLANRNTTIANAQMLLILKYIDNEIVKNRDYNQKYGLDRKIVVVIDEAHVFIDTKYPIALDFMFQLAKRIRKYNGMQIVITQNIKDFVGSEEIARKSTAIINACQYSFIFSLSPNDMQDLCTLYEKAGGINESEQEQIVQAPRGHAFTIMSPTSRSSFRITVPDDTHDLFSNPKYVNPYFDLPGGEKNWEKFISKSIEKNKESLDSKGKFDEEEKDNVNLNTVLFDEISLEEYEEEFNTKEDVKFNEEAKVTITETEVIPEKPQVTHIESSKTEEILAGLVDKLGTANMIDEIRKAVKEEVEKEVNSRLKNESTFELTDTQNEEPSENEGTSTSDSTEESFSLGNIFDFAGLDSAEKESAHESTEVSDEEESAFDVLAFLSQSSDVSNEDSDSTIFEFVDGTETILNVTLEQLINYNKKRFEE